MDDKITIDLDRETFDALVQRAEAHGTSVDREASEIVRESVATALSREDRDAMLRRFDEIAAMTPKGVKQTDSTLLIREDRDSR